MNVLLIVYDNGSFIPTFPQGIAYIASVLKKNDCKVTIYNQDIHHYSEEHLTSYLDVYHFDIVGVGVIGGYYQYTKLLKISEAINKSKNRNHFKFILGGHGPSPEPEYFLRKTKADLVIIGEGEEIILDIVNSEKYSDIEGIAYLDDEEVKINKKRKPIDDIDSISLPAYELFPIEYYRLFRYVNVDSTDFVMPVLSGRGCPFNCNFCFKSREGFRARNTKAIVDEIKFLQNRYHINVIDFSDELLMSSVARTTELCEAFLKENLNIRWHCNGRLNYANEDLLQLMKRAGCIFINYGIEALDDEVLRNMHKALTVEQIINGVENTLKVGISPGLNIIWGNIGDTKETLKKGVDFLLRYDDGAQLRTIRPVTGYPGTELYYHAIKQGLLKDVEEFYEKKHINSDLVAINFIGLSDEEFHKSLMQANKALITNYYQKKLVSSIKECENLYTNKNASFRGYRQF